MAVVRVWIIRYKKMKFPFLIHKRTVWQCHQEKFNAFLLIFVSFVGYFLGSIIEGGYNIAL